MVQKKGLFPLILFISCDAIFGQYSKQLSWKFTSTVLVMMFEASVLYGKINC